MTLYTKYPRKAEFYWQRQEEMNQGKEADQALQRTVRGLADNRVVRHTLGRVDALGRIFFGAIFSVLQAMKLAIKSGVFLITGELVDELDLKDELIYLCRTAKKTAKAVKDLILAPQKGYDSCFKEIYKHSSKIWGGKDVDVEEKFKGSGMSNDCVKATIRNAIRNTNISGVLFKKSRP